MRRRAGTLEVTALTLLVGAGTYVAINGLPFAEQNANQSNAQSMLATNFRHMHSYLQHQGQEAQQAEQQYQQPYPQNQQPYQQNQQPYQQNPGQSSVQSQQPNQTQNQNISMPASTQGSGNWAGYIDSPSSTGSGYTSVSGSWKVPSISGSADSVAAQWIGLGGVTSQDLLQMGTIEQFEDGQTVADIFWEQLPASAQNVMTVPVGSTINASIHQASGSTWDITFSAKAPSGQTLSKTIPVSINSTYAEGIGTSAEWISEDPSDENNNLYPLANMGTVDYTNALVNGQPFNSSGNQVQPVALVDQGSGNVLLAPSNVGADNRSFSTSTISTDTSDGGYGQYSQYGQYGQQGNGQSQWGQWGDQGQRGWQRHEGQYPTYGNGYGFGWR